MTLRRLYTALILPKLDFGSSLFATAAKYHLTKLDRIQYSAIRIILGILRPTPVNKIEAEANLMPLSLRRSKALVSYGCRIVQILKHPISTFLSSQSLAPSHLIEKYTFPALERLPHKLKGINIEYHMLPKLKMTSRYGTNRVASFCTLSESGKSELTNYQWNAVYLDMIAVSYTHLTLPTILLV